MKHIDSILIVDDDPNMHTIYDGAFGDKIIARAYDGVQGVALYKENKPDLVIMDWQMPNMNGIDATRAITDEYPDATIIMLSWAPNDRAARFAGALGAYDKSMDGMVIIETVESALETARMADSLDNA